MFKFKKGTEKPIEIFVALFIILAVAMIMLKMFKGQITEKSTEMKDLERENELEQALAESRLLCMEKCTQSYVADCSTKSKMHFCTYRVNPLDIDGDRTTNELDETILGGIGVCEDHIYCPMLYECRCGEYLDMVRCGEVAWEYWVEQGVADPASTMAKVFDAGYCVDAAYTGGEFWAETFFCDLDNTSWIIPYPMGCH